MNKSLVMKSFIRIIALSLVFVFLSCQKEKEKPKVIYESPTKTTTTAKADTTTVAISDLPIQMAGTDYLLYPIGELKSSDAGYDAASRSNDSGYRISNYSEYQITGFIRNVKFQKVGRDSIWALTDKNIFIQSITYLKSVADKTKQQILVYVMEDLDTNKDVKLDDNDIKSLYVSEITGGRFTKLSPDFQELIDWNIIESLNRIYYRTIEDTNKNGEFDKKDLLHYYYIDLASKDWKATEFRPN